MNHAQPFVAKSNTVNIIIILLLSPIYCGECNGGQQKQNIHTSDIHKMTLVSFGYKLILSAP